MDNVAINKARMVYYGLFSSLFSFSLQEEGFDTILTSVEKLMESPIDDQTEKALKKIHQRLKRSGFKCVKDESDKVFYSPVGSFVPMTASFYIESRDDGSKRLEMIEYLLKSRYRRDTDTHKENEDHIGFILLFMQKLIEEELAGDTEAGILAKKVFENVLNEFIDDFTNNLFAHENGVLLRQVAMVLSSFTDFERLFFNINKPEKDKNKNPSKPNIVKNKLNKTKHAGCV